MQSADLIRELRRRAGITQSELARRLGTSQPAVARWEAGRVDPGFEHVGRIARACDRVVVPRLVEVNSEDPVNLRANLEKTHAERLDELVEVVAFLTEVRRLNPKREPDS